MFVSLVVLALLVKDSMAKNYCDDDTQHGNFCSRCQLLSEDEDFEDTRDLYNGCCEKEKMAMLHCEGLVGDDSD